MYLLGISLAAALLGKERALAREGWVGEMIGRLNIRRKIEALPAALR